MASRLERHQARVEALQQLGRPLVRRARSRCELCEAGETALSPWEVPPSGEEPELERTVLVCGRCRSALEGGRLEQPQALRFLEGAAWSPLPAVQVCAVRLLRRLADAGQGWAQDALEGLVLEEEVAAWVEA